MMMKKGIPKTKNKVIQTMFSKAEKDLQLVAKGKELSDEPGMFGEARELLVFELARAKDEAIDSLAKANSAQEVLMEIFRDVRDEPSVSNIIQSMTLGLYGLILGNYDGEDFRYIYRYSLKHVRNQQKIEVWLRKALVLLAACQYDDELEIMTEIRFWLQFLGAPVFSPASFVTPGEELNVKIQSVVESEELKLVDALTRHPQYLREAIEGRKFLDIYNACKEWTPDGLLSKLLSITREKVYKDAQEGVGQDMDVGQSFDAVKTHFEKNQFQTHKKAVMPVRLQELPSPPPGEAVDPVIFELIPQKLRMGLLPAVAFSRKTKSIEIIFLGGPRIGRSGILIKTDTGGVLLDFGISVANHRIPEWVPEIEMVDTILVSHGHLDHLGGLPILFDKFEGKWCSVGPTGGIAKILLTDALKVGTPAPPRRYDKHDLVSKFNEDNIKKVTDNHVRLEYGKSNEVSPGIVVTPIDANHIPGSAAYSIDVEGTKILYTGDFNTDESALFPGAALPTDSDYVIFDGTYWGREDFNRKAVSETMSNIIANHGPVVIPSFAVGRSQEILTILENLGITKNRNVMVTGMADRVTNLVGVKGSWESMKKNKVHLNEDDILVAGGGMLGGGLARFHFNEQRNNPKAAIILCGYLAPRTPGWNLLHGYEPHECTMEYARLSAHSSAGNLQNYIHSCSGKRIIVHTPTETAPKGLTMPDYRDRIIVKT
ncbi:MAG: MBL fold metallo-hydrolase [Candidatus Thorarchaeota archaeon]|jgi:putative mRNA 3-end processing factor